MKALIWSGTDEVLPGSATPMVLHRPLPLTVLERLRHCSRSGERGIKGLKHERLTSVVSLQGVYRLTESAAADFASVVGAP